MTARPRRPLLPSDVDALLARMDAWPTSWAGIAKDEGVGRNLTDLMRLFVLSLVQRHLAPKTIRRHLDNLWVIGGEIIRQLHDTPSRRTKAAKILLLDATADGELCWVSGLTEAQQRTVDATARKLFGFLVS